MAYNFPANPVDGQLYPDPVPPGVTQYVWSDRKGTWLTIFRGVEKVSATAPLFTSGSLQQPIVNIVPVSTQQGGYMTAKDKQKLDSIDPNARGTVTSIVMGPGLGSPNTGNTITTTGTINLLPPSAAGALGGVRAGANVDITTAGTLSVKPPTPTVIGGVKQGSGVTIAADGTISVAAGSGYKVLDNISARFNGSTTNFVMTVSGVTYTPPNIQSLLIFVGGVIQVPPAFSITGSQLIFSAPPASGTTFYGVSLL